MIRARELTKAALPETFSRKAAAALSHERVDCVVLQETINAYFNFLDLKSIDYFREISMAMGAGSRPLWRPANRYRQRPV